MDALSIISKYTKHEGKIMNRGVVNVINKINEKRKDSVLTKYSRFEENFGAERAKTAAEQRRAAEQAKKKGNSKEKPKTVAK